MHTLRLTRPMSQIAALCLHNSALTMTPLMLPRHRQAHLTLHRIHHTDHRSSIQPDTHWRQLHTVLGPEQVLSQSRHIFR